jgi:hypothetical protein
MEKTDKNKDRLVPENLYWSPKVTKECIVEDEVVDDGDDNDDDDDDENSEDIKSGK